MNVTVTDQGSQITGPVFSKHDMAANGGVELKQDEASDKSSNGLTSSNKKTEDFKLRPQSDSRRIRWLNVLFHVPLHSFFFYAILRLPQCRLFTLAFGVIYYVCGILGVTAGVHRYWTHRSYKAKLPLQIILMIFQSLAMQDSIFNWARNHRTHHKFSDTNADPHNSREGFFFSHVGWVLMTKHKDVVLNRRNIFVDDLLKDPVVSFQKRHYLPLAITFGFVLPTLVPWYIGGETFFNAFCAMIVRYYCVYHATFSINSFAHMFGCRPYDKQICPTENMLVSGVCLGEGFHNYHHAFPHDYAAGEFGTKFNLTTAFIDMMAALGQVYDRRVANKDTIEARKRRTGELSDLKNVAL